MPKPPEEEGFLNRWSRVKTEGNAPEAKREAETPEAPPEKELTDAEILEKLGLPDPLTLKEGDDVRGFMSAQVPEHLRRVALRFLWRSNPVLANVDGLIDYGEDFTDAATVIENMQTVYQVGKGAAWKFKAEQEAEAAAGTETEPEADMDVLHSTQDVPDEAVFPDEPAPPATSHPEDEPIQTVTLEGETAAERAVASAPRPRPMRFEFD